MGGWSSSTLVDIPANLLADRSVSFQKLEPKIDNGKVYLFNYTTIDELVSMNTGDGNLSLKELMKLNPKFNFILGYIKVKE